MTDRMLQKRTACPNCGRTVALKTLIYSHKCNRPPGRPPHDSVEREQRLWKRAVLAVVTRLMDDADPSPSLEPHHGSSPLFVEAEAQELGHSFDAGMVPQVVLPEEGG